MDDPTAKLVFEHNDTCSYSDSYKGRSQVFNNCSLFLTNLTNNDAGQYRCIFTVDTMRKRWLVNVIVSGKSGIFSILLYIDHPDCLT